MSTDPSPELREQIENTIRFLTIDATNRANSGHPGAPMGLARPAFELWDAHLRFDPQDAQWPLVSQSSQASDVDDQIRDVDSVLDGSGVRVIVDEKSALYLVGSVLDFVDSLQESGFKIENPNASNSCGCGQSFSA